MQKWLVVAATALAAAAITSVAEKTEQPPAKPQAATAERVPLLPQRLVKDLALSPEQSAKLEELTTEFNKARAAHMAAHRAEMEAMRKEMQEARAAGDQQRHRQLRLKLGELMRPVGELRRSYVEKFRAVLTAEQQQKLEQFFREQRRHARERRAAAPGMAAEAPAAQPQPKKDN